MNAAVCVIVEIFLNAVDALTWDWAWWSARSPIPIFLFGYLHFYLEDHDDGLPQVHAATAIGVFPGQLTPPGEGAA